MKDTLITARQKKIELYLLLASMIIAYALNVIGIIKYSSPAKELVTQLPRVLLIGVILYVTVAVVRLIVYLISTLIKK